MTTPATATTREALATHIAMIDVDDVAQLATLKRLVDDHLVALREAAVPALVEKFSAEAAKLGLDLETLISGTPGRKRRSTTS